MAKKIKTNKETDGIYIRNVPGNTRNALKNIAANEGSTLSGFLKPHLRNIVNSYPDTMKTNKDI